MSREVQTATTCWLARDAKSADAVPSSPAVSAFLRPLADGPTYREGAS
jgi:hypothetical protein